MRAASARAAGFRDARVGAATLGAAALVAQQVVGKALRDTLFLASFGVEKLPFAMMGAAVLSGVLVLVLSRTVVTHSPRRVARAVLVLSAALFLLAWALASASPHAAAAVTYLHAGALSAASVSVFWTLVCESFDPYAARSAVPRIMAGATLGGVVGGLVTWRAAAWLAPADLLPLGALLNALSLAAVSRLRGGAPRGPQARDTVGWRVVRELPYLRSLATLVVAGALTQALLDYLLSSAALSSLGRGPRLLSFFALFQTGVGVLSFLLQVGVSRSTLERFGVGAALLASPTLLLLGVAAALFAPPLVATVLLRGSDGVLGASLHRSAYEVLFAPLEHHKKRAAKPILDVAFDRLGALLGAGLVALVVALAPASAPSVLLVGVAALAVARMLLSPLLQAGYRRSLADNLRQGRLGLSSTGILDEGTVGSLSRGRAELDRTALLAEVARFRAEQARATSPETSATRLSIAAFDLPVGPELDDPGGPGGEEEGSDDTLEEMADLRSGVEGRVRGVLRRCRTAPLLTPQVVELLADDRVARDAADWLTAQEPLPVGLLTDALLADRLPEPARRRVARLLGKSDDPRAAEGLLTALPQVPTSVRRGVAYALARLATKRPVPREPLLAAVVRVAAEPLRPGDPEPLEEMFCLLSAAYPRQPVQRALRALEGGGEARGTALEWLDVLLPHEVKVALWPRIVRSGEHIRATPRDVDELRRALSAPQLALEPEGESDA